MVVKVVRCGHFALIRSEVAVVVKAKRASRQSIKVCFFSTMESDAVNSFSEVLRSSPLSKVSWALWNGPLSLGLPLRPTGKSCESSEQLSKNGLSHGHAENSQFHLGWLLNHNVSSICSRHDPYQGPNKTMRKRCLYKDYHVSADTIHILN